MSGIEPIYPSLPSPVDGENSGLDQISETGPTVGSFDWAILFECLHCPCGQGSIKSFQIVTGQTFS